MIKKGIIILALITAHQISFAQVTSFGFKEGTIEKKDGSLIECYVEFAVTYYSKVAYKLTKDGEELSLKSSEVKSIKTPFKYIENITLDGKERLMAMVTEGHVTLFNHVTINPGKTEKGYGGTFNFNAPPIVIYAVKKGDNYYEIKKRDFKQRLSDLLCEQPSVVEYINRREFKLDDMESAIAEYNSLYEMQALKRQITARVVDSKTKKPIKDAKVKIQGTSVEAVTNFLGFVQVTIEAIDTLLVQHPEYEIGLIKIPDVNNFQIGLTKLQSRNEQ